MEGSPPKPWERAKNGVGNAEGAPFLPSNPTASTVDVVSSAGTANTDTSRNPGTSAGPVTAGGALQRNMPSRPWERPGAMSGSYNSPLYSRGVSGYDNYSSTYGSGIGGYGGGGVGYGRYGSGIGGYGSYGSSYGMGYPGSTSSYSGLRGGYGMGGLGMGGLGMSGYGMGGGLGMNGGLGMGGGYGYGGMPPMNGDPNDPNAKGPPQPPRFWQMFCDLLARTMHFLGNIAVLVTENTNAMHFFISALLQLCDRAGILYGELARFVLRILGYRRNFKPGAPKDEKSLVVPGAVGPLAGGKPAKVQGAEPAMGSWETMWPTSTNSE